MGRCLVYSHRPEVLLPMAREWVARGKELLAFGESARVLASGGVPLARQPVYSGSGAGEQDVVSQMLHPRILGALLGDWGQADQRDALERQGLRRIDVVIVDLPEPDRVAHPLPEDMAAAVLLRVAAWNHAWTLPLCDLQDAEDMLSRWDNPDEIDRAFRESMALKALAIVGGLDSAMSVGLKQEVGAQVPDAWLLQSRRMPGIEFEGIGNWRYGLYSEKSSEEGGGGGFGQLSGPPLVPRVLLDAEMALACLVGFEAPAVALVHNRGLCGFEAALCDEAMTEAFSRARRMDPRGAFGAVVGLNREVDAATARSLGAAFIEAVVAPSFSAEARAALSKTRTRLLQAELDGAMAALCRSTRWGMLLAWPGVEPDCSSELVSQAQPDPAQERALALAWRLVRVLPGFALVAADEHHMLAAAWAQTSLREAAMMVAQKLGVVSGLVVAACDSSFRFAEDVDILSECGVSALLHLCGSPRQAEISARVDQLGIVMKVVDERSLGGKI